ncbi:MalY/PatB family protein [Desulfoscipio gibsoniae]|uniref:cysteine-S-conjugate beta-lyase n=1 Tax=Desulfoscipio gibsoniae DSM 7213 TaxID=767817 RepID=R4KKB7_9FIRM|nr:PatB family C-S lyase [Desulfoscipio gibsoniae]AGL00990.1 bifunctional PLP-dependent enzyme with beta-cystathionase and maltose regulon repressor activities [Desulfoscipio gibsoniae DSM 7213]
MLYNFDDIINRKNTNSMKWDNIKLFGRDDLINMWVADMDFPCPEPVVKALKERAEYPVYGYSFPPDSLYEAIVERLDRNFGWEIKKEWIVFTAGVVNGLYSAVRAFTYPGDEVVVQPPVYYPFFNAIKDNGCQVLHNHLAFDGERYTMDFNKLEELFKPITSFPVRMPRIKMLILCSPHNPVGRVWSKEELTALGEICIKNNCMLISDEIHGELMVGDVKHTVTATISQELEQQSITFMSASKTFNLAGLATSFAVIPNDHWRREFIKSRAGYNSGNFFGFTALEAAFRYGDEYLSQLLLYLRANVKFFTDYINNKIPRLKVIKPEGTYLAWVDMRNLGMNTLELQDFIRSKARLALDDGYAFGPGGEGFQRFNLACPRIILQQALERLEQAVEEL